MFVGSSVARGSSGYSLGVRLVVCVARLGWVRGVGWLMSRLSDCRSVWLPAVCRCLPAFPLSVCPSEILSVCLVSVSVGRPVGWSIGVCLFVYLSVGLVVCLFVRLVVYLFACLLAYLVASLLACLLACVFVCLCVGLLALLLACLLACLLAALECVLVRAFV